MSNSSSIPTFANQDTLPRLPIPSLSDTLNKYRYSLQAILSPQQLAITDTAIEKSLHSGILTKLQDRLHNYDKSQPNSWLEHWWYNVAYLSWRVPLLINSNWWLFLRDDHIPYLHNKIIRLPPGSFTSHQVKRAVGLITNLLNFKHLLDTNTYPPQVTRSGPLCMDQYRHMFGVNRIALSNVDEIYRSFPCLATHIVVLVRDQCFKVPVFDQQGRRLSLSQLESLLNQIISIVTADDFIPNIPISILTAEHRDTWANARHHLLSLSPINKLSLDIIESALFTLSLDDWSTSSDLDESQRAFAHGFNAHNRWFDKALNIIVMANGRAGCNGEHSPQDALIPAIMFEYVIANEPAHNSINFDANNQDIPSIQHLNFVGDTMITQYLTKAEHNNRTILHDSDIGVLIFHDYGTDFIKRHANMSPDTYMQLAMQLAHRTLHGHLVPTYETASTRLFRHGRTETTRTLLPEVKQWADSMVNNNIDKLTKLELIQKAANAHAKYIKEASNGMGIDRHLLGLRLVMKKDEICPLFNDEAYTKSQTWQMSTSGLSPNSYKAIVSTGFGCVVPNGYGINYFAGPHQIHFGIESKYSCPITSTDLFRFHILAALRDLRILFDSHVQDGIDKSKL